MHVKTSINKKKSGSFFSWIFLRPVLFGIIVLIVILSLVGMILFQRYQKIKGEDRQHLSQVLESTKSRLQLSLDQGLLSTQSLAFIVKEGGLSMNFDSAAASLLAYNHYIDALELVPDGIIKYVYPLNGNESVLGYNILEDSLRNSEAYKAIDRKNIFFAGPLQLKQGGIGIIGRLPVFINNKFWGFSAVVIKLSTLLKAAGIDTTGNSGYYFQLSKVNPQTNKEENFLPEHDISEGSSTSIMLPAGEWKLLIGEVAANKVLTKILPGILLGILLSFLTAWVAYFLAQKPAQLEKIVNEKSFQLEKTNKRNDAIVNAIPDIIFILDENGRFIDYNNPYGNPMLTPPENFIGKLLTEVMPGDISSKLLENIKEVIKTKKTILDPYQLQMEGIIRYYEATYSLSGEKEVLVIVRDITSRVANQMVIKKSQEHLWQVLNSTVDIFYVVDSDYTVTLINKIAEKSLAKAWGAEVKVGTNILKFLPKEEDEPALKSFQKAFSGEGVEYELSVSLPELPEWVQVTYSPVRDANDAVTRVAIITKDITKRKKAEEKLAQSYRRLELIGRTTNDAVWEWNIKTDHLWGNEIHQALYGLTFNDPVPTADMWIERIHPDDRERVVSKQEKILASNKNVIISEYRFRIAKNEYIDIYDRCYIVRDEGGKAVLMTGSMMNITERKKAERKLKESEEKYRTLVEQAVDAIALYDGKGNILDINTGSLNLLGYSKSELMGMCLSDILTGEEIEKKPVRYDVLKRGESTVKQRDMRKKDGSVIHTEVRSQQLPDGRFLSVIRDLSERIKAQEQIEREKELSDKIIDSLPGVFYWYDENGHFLRWNKQMELVTGYSAEEISKMHPTDFFEGEARQYISQRIENVFAEGISDAEADFIGKDGSKHPYYFKAIRVEFDGKPCLLGTGIDISDRLKAEKELEASYESVRKLTKHLQNIREEERAHIAREIHDELGQQLTVIKMDVSWINKRVSPSADDTVKGKMKELLTSLDDIVKSVRRISSELRPSVLDDLGLVAAMEWQLTEFEKRSGIKTMLHSSENEMHLTNPIKTALFRIFQESLTNVARHSEAKNLSVNLEEKNNNFVLVITDDGKGFDKQKIAEKRTLGILGMNERASMIGGNYTIISTPGKGTTISVSVPAGQSDNL